jgi:hypothetical protein
VKGLNQEKRRTSKGFLCKIWTSLWIFDLFIQIFRGTTKCYLLPLAFNCSNPLAIVSRDYLIEYPIPSGCSSWQTPRTYGHLEKAVGNPLASFPEGISNSDKTTNQWFICKWLLSHLTFFSCFQDSELDQEPDLKWVCLSALYLSFPFPFPTPLPRQLSFALATSSPVD